MRAPKFTDEYQSPTVMLPSVVIKGPKTWIPDQSFRRSRGGYELPRWVWLEASNGNKETLWDTVNKQRERPIG